MLMRGTTAINLVAKESLVTTGEVDLAATTLTTRGDTAAAFHVIITRVRRGMSVLAEIFFIISSQWEGTRELLL